MASNEKWKAGGGKVTEDLWHCTLPFIVGEVSKNWPDDGAPPNALSLRFQRIVNDNYKRGYELHSFTLHRLMHRTEAGRETMNETIIAVFQRRIGWAVDPTPTAMEPWTARKEKPCNT